MSLTNSDAEAKWIWFDSNTWQSYDDETNKQIEDAYINGAESVKLNCGSLFGKYQNVYRVYFNHDTNPPSFTQINVITKDMIQIRRTLAFKPRRFINNSSSDEHIVINHQNDKKIKKINKKKSNKHSNSSSKIYKSPYASPSPSPSLLSNIKRIQIYKHLYNNGFNKQSIDKAIKIFNNKFKSDSPILNQSINDIIQELIHIMSNGYSNGFNGHINDIINDDDDDDDEDIIDFKIGAWIEVNINNNWLPGKIIDINWSYSNPVNLSIEYQDIFNKRLSKQIKLNGRDININKVRPCNSNSNINSNSSCSTNKTNRFNINFDDNWRNDNDNLNGRFNRNNLSIHKFNFEYHKDNTKYDEKNAKHPSEYINRKCFKCKGSGKCMIEKERERECDYKLMGCTKCINSSGIYRKANTLIHSKCNGLGCPRCNESGKYPLHDILCNNCKGSGMYRVSNVSNTCIIVDEWISNDNNHNINAQSYNQCMNGYRLPQLIPFVPKRENKKLSVHGIDGMDGSGMDGTLNNMKRLYHATTKHGANGIIETGVMFGGHKSHNGSSYGEGICFGESGRYAQIKAKKKGYLVIADVFTGKCKDEYYIENDMNFNKLHQTGYDSIRKYSNQNGIEYVVFNWDQVWVHVVLPFEQVNFAALK